MKPLKKIKKILWAVDAHQANGAALNNIAKTVRRYATFFDAKVTIAYACVFPQVLSERTDFPFVQHEFLEQAVANLHALVGKLDPVPTSLALLSALPSKKIPNELALLLDYAKKEGFDLIVVATHGRNVLQKLFVGSFTEGVLKKAAIPVMVIPPHPKKTEAHAPKRILIPTDFSKTSRNVLDTVANVVNGRKVNLHLVHGLTNRYIPAVLSDATLMGVYYPMQSAVFKDSLKQRQADMAKWLATGKKRRLSLSGEVYGTGGLVSDIITHAAQRSQADLIVMASGAGAPSFESFGSVTKKVIRHASAPVLVFGSAKA